MGFLDGIFGKKRDNSYDWIEIDHPLTKWVHIGNEVDNEEFYVDENSCFLDKKGLTWWKQKTGVANKYYEYSICFVPPGARNIMVPIRRVLSEPFRKKLRGDLINRMIPIGTFPMLDQSMERAVYWGKVNNFPTEMVVPYVWYAYSILREN